MSGGLERGELSERGAGLPPMPAGAPGRIGTTAPAGQLGPSVRVALPSHLYPPPDAVWVDVTADWLLVPNTLSLVVQQEIPINQVLHISAIGWDADDDGALSFLRWSVQRNADPIPGLVNLVASIGSVSAPQPVGINVPGPASVGVYALNTVNQFAWTFQARLVGYLFNTAVR